MNHAGVAFGERRRVMRSTIDARSSVFHSVCIERSSSGEVEFSIIRPRHADPNRCRVARRPRPRVSRRRKRRSTMPSRPTGRPRTHVGPRKPQRCISRQAPISRRCMHGSHGRTYRVEKTGTQFYRAPAVQGTFENRVDIPDDYDPSTKLPLRAAAWRCHARAGRGRPADRSRRPDDANRIAGEKQIVIQPSGWIQSAVVVGRPDG